MARPPAFSLGPIPVRIEWSGLLLSALLAGVLFMRADASGESTTSAVLLAVAGGLSFLASILFHELGHAFEARHRDLPVDGVRLFLLGGVTQMGRQATRPRDEFAVAAAGPFISLLIAAVLGTFVTVVDNTGLSVLDSAAGIVGILAWLNISLALFNLIPGSPLDGGRMLRAGLWKLTGDRERAVRGAALSGMLVALALAAFAFTRFDTAGGPFEASWFLFLAWFMGSAAASEHRHSRAWSRLGARTVDGLTPPPAVAIDAAHTVAHSLSWIAADVDDEQPMMTTQPGTRGVVLVQTLREVPVPDRDRRLVGELATPITDLAEVAPEAPVTDLVTLLRDRTLATQTTPAGVEVWTLRRLQDALDAERPERRRRLRRARP